MAHKLLLADDSVTIQKVVELILAEEDFEIRSVGSGEEALAALAEFRPDIILADIEMPKINGYQLCEMIKQDTATGNIPVILLAGAFEPVDEELADQVRADDFLVKPFESQELISKLNAALTISTVEEADYGEEAEALVEAETLSLEEPSIVPEEDLWAMEETPEAAEASVLAEEEPVTAGLEEMLELAEEIPEEAAAETTGVAPASSEEREIEVPAGARMEFPERNLPSKDELKAVFEKVVNEKVSSFLASLEVKETILALLTPAIKDSVEKILWEVTPDLVERMLKEMLRGSLESLTKEVEKVIWETVPDLAETMITKEIERIRSEF
ncbi:MAG: response regulator [Thermodesulfovibrionales bacterium]|nr:response regulator [Thermodesulfovibrionales bacterium]